MGKEDIRMTNKPCKYVQHGYPLGKCKLNSVMTIGKTRNEKAREKKKLRKGASGGKVKTRERKRKGEGCGGLKRRECRQRMGENRNPYQHRVH